MELYKFLTDYYFWRYINIAFLQQHFIRYKTLNSVEVLLTLFVNWFVSVEPTDFRLAFGEAVFTTTPETQGRTRLYLYQLIL